MAEVAGRPVCKRITAASAITETLQRVTPEPLLVEHVRTQLADAIRAGVPEPAACSVLTQHPLAVWVELTLGLTRDEGKWRRARPVTLDATAEQLAADAGVDIDQAKAVLSGFLLLAYRTTAKLPAEGGRSLFAFKLHQFISGSSKEYSTLEHAGRL